MRRANGRDADTTQRPNPAPAIRTALWLVLTAPLLVLTLVFAAHHPAHAQNGRQTISVGLCDYYPPYYHKLKNGSWRGVFITFLEAFEQANPQYRIKLVNLPRKRMDHALRKGSVDVFGLNSPLFTSPDDLMHSRFSRPLWRSCDHVAVRAGSPFEYTGPRSLEGRTLGLIHGNGYGPLDEALESGKICQERARGGPKLIRMLVSGHVDLAVLNDHSEVAAITRMNIGPDSIRLLEPPLYCFDLCVQVSRGRDAFLRDLNEFILAAQSSGLLDELRDRAMNKQ